MLDQGIIQPSCSPSTSLIVLFRKKDGSWRLCVDYRDLNKSTIKNKFPILIVDDLLGELGGSKIFSKIDLRYGYHQLQWLIRICLKLLSELTPGISSTWPFPLDCQMLQPHFKD